MVAGDFLLCPIPNHVKTLHSNCSVEVKRWLICCLSHFRLESYSVEIDGPVQIIRRGDADMFMPRDIIDRNVCELRPFRLLLGIVILG